MKYMMIAVLLIRICWAQGAVGENSGIRVMSPFPNSIHHEETASIVVVMTSPAVEGIVITGEGNQSVTLMRRPKKETYCKSIRLVGGENAITVQALRKDGRNEMLRVSVYHDIVTEKVYKYPPERFVMKKFHLANNEKECGSCHNMTINETPGIAFENPAESNCFPCHQKIIARGQGHAPAVNWMCTSCHKPAQTEAGDANLSGSIPKFSLSKKVGEECLSCHKKERETWNEKRFHHMPVDAAQCVRCHNPHSSENPYFLRAKPWALCTSCHTDKINGSHILNTWVNKIHPTQGKPDPSRPGKELECISCHNPHASDTRSLIEGKSPMSICQKCHKK